MKNVLVSVVIPTYNRPDLLRRSLRSAIQQSHKNIEILVVNDSDDEEPVRSVIAQFGDARIQYLRNKRIKGGNGSRNTGIQKSNGEYIAFLDDDDEWFPTKIADQVKLLSNNTGRFQGIISGFVEEKAGKWKEYRYKFDKLELGHFLTSKYRIGSSSNIMLNRDALFDVGLWDEELVRQQDLELMARFLSKYEIGILQKPTVKVYGHNDPEPKKSFEAREVYFSIVEKFLPLVIESVQRDFYSYHYRKQMSFLIKMRRYGDAFRYYRKALKYRLLVPRKDAKNALVLLKEIV